ncbi:MAG: hypothetical protein GEU90_10860 [Gemmatimonas sp.]|nr:hypothetical protein [Gemmatimonas sp.]
MTRPRYSATSAATVGLGIAIVTAALLGFTGFLYLRGGGAVGWLLITLGLLPLFFAIVVRLRIRLPPEGGDDPAS